MNPEDEKEMFGLQEKILGKRIRLRNLNQQSKD